MSVLQRLAHGWRTVQRGLSTDLHAGLRRGYSDAAGGGAKGNPLSSETPTAHKLFENVRMPVESVGAAGAHNSAGAAASEAAGLDALHHTPGWRAVTALGNALFYGAVSATAIFGYYTYRYDVQALEHMVEETKHPENAFPGSSLWVPVMSWYVDKRRAAESELKKYADPPSDRLLPDLPPHARHIKTLVLDLDDLLVHSDWTRGRGWRTFKRPGAEDFIRDMSQYFELVVYTAQLPTYADPILDRLDPQRLVTYRLYRDSTQYANGKHVRDLSKLNRDLKQVLLLTADADAYALQPDNAIKLPKWTTAASGDVTLLDLLPFLEAVVKTNVADVRDVVRSYEGQDIPTAFRERMLRVQQAKSKRNSSIGFLGKAQAR